jgi:excisionase family DNA binding protein
MMEAYMPQNLLPTDAAAIPQIKPETVQPQFLTIAELVTATKISRQTISRKLKNGEIPHAKVGSRILIPASFLFDLEKKAWTVINKRVG